MEMIEQVARAIHAKHRHPDDNKHWFHEDPEQCQHSRQLAKAAIEANGGTQRERRLFEALYALAKAADRVIDGDGGQAFRSLEAALVVANEALAYPTTEEPRASDALPGLAVPSDP
jgi:hypothetical protein